ncbi:uncharacterized protein STEHIDRAFT_125318, partial [Stereum hirsutum FP-91666 SS1]|uniref:uncharacterized protein n=1 Tax=Stereum hirsutum (strain FP-91666) TaxID=721885 RepID=UPI00044497D2
MRGSDTAVASLEDASAPVRTNAKNALKPRRRAVRPSTHITPVLSANSQTYKSALSISYRAPSPFPSSDDRSPSPSPPGRRSTPRHTPNQLRSPRLANISTSATLPQRHRHTKSLVTQPSVSPLSLSPSTPLSKLPPSPLSPPLSTFRFPAPPQPQTPSSLRRFTTCPVSPTSSTRSTS